MHLTQHAALRSQQRCIPEILIDLLLRFGSKEAAGSGTSKIFFDKRARRQINAYAGPLANLLVEHLDLYAVVGEDDQVITVAHRNERIKRH